MSYDKNPLRSRHRREAVWHELADSFDVSVSEMQLICSGLESRKSPGDIRKQYKLPYHILSNINQIANSDIVPLRHKLNAQRQASKKDRKAKVLKTLTNLDFKRLITAKHNCAFCNSQHSLRSCVLRCVDSDTQLVYTRVSSCAMCDRSRQGKTLTQWYASMRAQAHYGTDKYEEFKNRLRLSLATNYDPILLNSKKQKRFQFYLAKRNN